MAKMYRREKIERFIEKLETMLDEPLPKDKLEVGSPEFKFFVMFMRYREDLIDHIILEMRREFDIWDEEDKE